MSVVWRHDLLMTDPGPETDGPATPADVVTGMVDHVLDLAANLARDGDGPPHRDARRGRAGTGPTPRIRRSGGWLDHLVDHPRRDGRGPGWPAGPTETGPLGMPPRSTTPGRTSPPSPPMTWTRPGAGPAAGWRSSGTFRVRIAQRSAAGRRRAGDALDAAAAGVPRSRVGPSTLTRWGCWHG